MIHNGVEVKESLYKVTKVYLYREDGLYVLRSREHILHQFTSAEEALSWWRSFCAVVKSCSNEAKEPLRAASNQADKASGGR